MKLKNIATVSVGVLALLCSLTSCEDYLDKAPSMGVDESEVYNDYESVTLFLDGAYKWVSNDLEYGSLGNQYSWNGGMSDECACCYNSHGLSTMHSGNWGATNISGYELGDNGTASLASDSGTIIFRSYRTIRICNAVIDNYSQVTMTQDEEDKLLGQAYFLRAWSYFQLIRRYGGMPDLTKLYDDFSDYDQPRLDYHGSTEILIADLDAAIDRLPELWDESNGGRANKVAAMAVKSMALLYDASPLMQNSLDETVAQDFNKERALLAAQYTKSVIDYLDKKPNLGRLSCTPGAVIQDYEKIFHWSQDDYSVANGGDGSYYKPEEALWYNRDVQDDRASSIRIFFLPQTWATIGSTGGNWVYSYFAPSQNMVDMFEKKSANDGLFYPISDPRSGYEIDSSGAVVDMYVNRDPRLEENILLPGQTRGLHQTEGTPLENTYYSYYNASNTLTEGKMRSDAENAYMVNREQSGYVINKYIWDDCSNHGIYGTGTYDFSSERHITVFVRVAHLYLNYAEALYEALGDYNATTDGCDMTALEALNIIRNRGGITDWQSGYEDFREAYRRERCVEFMFEHSRWFDIRRWMIAEELFSAQYPIKGVYAIRHDYNQYYDAVAGTADDYSIGKVAGFRNVTTESGTFTCTPVELKPENRVFAKRNYWYPFSSYDVDALSNLKQNPGW